MITAPPNKTRLLVPISRAAEGMRRCAYERLCSEAWQAEMHAEERLTIFRERLKRVEGQRRIVSQEPASKKGKV
jgi:hypothetical protein